MNFEYLIYSLLFLSIWGVIYYLRPDLRKSTLYVSLRTAPIGPISQIWFLSDYWKINTITNTVVGIEDLIFAFAIGGISWSIYKTIFNKRIELGRKDKNIAIKIAIATVLVMIIFTNIFSYNSVLVSATWFMVLGAYLIYEKSYPLSKAVYTGLLVLAVFVLVYIAIQLIYPWAFQAVCVECNPSGIRILGINLEEIYWDFSWGFLAAPAYDIYMGASYVDDEN